MENINCIFCNASENKIIIEENGYQGRKCLDCGLIYISPRPSLTEMADLYGHDQANISSELHIASSYIKRLYAKHNIQIIRKYIKKGTILEIGAGAGYFLDEARKDGFDVCGIELNTIQADFIRKNFRIPCEEKALSGSSFKGKKFDIIYHCDVISHFFNPISEFQKIREKLEQNGIVVFETGNLGDVEEGYLKLFTKFQYPDHLFFFSEENLKNLLIQTGFKVLKIYRYSILPEFLIMNKLNGLIKKIRKENQNVNKAIAPEKKDSLDNKKDERKIKRYFFNCYNYLNYFIRYKVGYIMPKKGRPQTIIIVAATI